MSLRQRLTVLTAAAVALSIVAAAAVAWLLVRSSMMEEVDESLISRAHDMDQIVSAARSPRPGDAPEQRLIEMVQADPVGVQIVEPGGRVYQVAFEPLTSSLEDASLPESPPAGDLRLDTVTLGAEHYRVLALTDPDGVVLRLIRPLSSVDSTLDSVAWSLAGIGAAGIALAAALGWAVSRAGLRPVDRLTAAAESVARTQDLTERVDAGPSENDEVARLARSVNTMLAALDKARSDQRQLVENASHELRTPLTVLRNDFGLLRRAERDPSRALTPQGREELLADLDTQVAALGEEVDEIIALAKGDQSSEPVQETELLELIARAVQRTRGLRPEVGIEVLGEQTVAPVHASVLERAVANLVRNAVQVSSAGGTVRVLLQNADQHRELSIVVEDEGPGLREDEIPRLFTRFFRGADSRDRHGSGLGLAIVEQAAAAHSGTVEAANREGGGSRFALTWPRDAPSLRNS